MKVICISGKAQHGKDTAARYLKEELESNGCKVLVTHYADLVKYVCANFFGWDGVKDEKGRHLLQFVGTDVVRAQNPDYWVDFVISILTMFKGEWEYVIIPDCRFPNEIEKMRNAGFDVMHMRVIRPDFDNGLTSEAKNHPSETSLDNAEYDNLLYNYEEKEYELAVKGLAREMVRK